MYKDYYHLQADPFSTHPNTDTFFVSETHKEAWYYLLFGIDTQEPFLLLTGEYGMGKTLLCLRLIKALKEKGVPRVEYIPTCNEGYGGILRRMAATLGISTTPEDEEILQDMIYDRFRADTENSRFYLIIDDAHELDPSILTKLKYLSTFNHNEFFPVIMIFVGHPSFLQGLKTPALSSLNQRIKRRCHLSRFSFEDTKNYIYFRLLKSGATGIPAFPEETIQKIFEYSGGVPRLINNISDTCLLIGASKKLISIPPAIVDSAKKLLEGSLPEERISAVAPPPVAETKVKADEAPRVEMPRVVSVSGEGAGRSPLRLPQEQTVSVAAEEEYEPEIAPRKVTISGYGPSGKKVARIAAVVLILLAFLWLFRDAITDGRLISLFAPRPQEALQSGAQTGDAARTDPAGKTGAEAPVLREEMAGKPPAQAPAEREGAAEVGRVPETAAPIQPDSATSRKSARMEAPAAAGKENLPAHPYSLRVASYQKQERAASEVAELRKLGLTPYLVKADLGDLGILWRVYVGFFSTEEEAGKAKNAYKLATAAVQRTEYACYAGDFSGEADGMQLYEKYKKSGHVPYAVQKGQNQFRLYLGAYEKRADAEALQKELESKGLQSQVVKR